MKWVNYSAVKMKFFSSFLTLDSNLSNSAAVSKVSVVQSKSLLRAMLALVISYKFIILSANSKLMI